MATTKRELHKERDENQCGLMYPIVLLLCYNMKTYLWQINHDVTLLQYSLYYYGKEKSKCRTEETLTLL